MSTTRITDNDYADVALYDKVNTIADEIDNEVSQKANSSNTVTTDTTQTITGGKTFTTDIKRTINIDVTTPPASNKYIVPFVVETTDQSLRAYQQVKQETNGKITYTIGLRRTVNGENKFNVIDFEIDAAGNTAVKVLNPSSSSNDQSVATTAWVNNFCKTTNRTITAVYGDNTNWRRVWSDGWIEQGGIITGTASGNTYSVTKTFPQAYQNIPTLLINYLSTKGLGYQTMRALTTTYFTAVTTSTGDNYHQNSNGFAWYACGY